MSGPSGSSISGNGDEKQSRSQISSQLQPPTNGTANTTDPASSLRAAALLTLKSKRKKPLNDSDPSALLAPRARTPARSTFQLDYGQDDSSSAAQSDYLATTSTTTVPCSSTSPQDADDSQAREEGEISDSDAAAAAKLQPSIKKDIKKFKQSDSAARFIDSPSSKPAEPLDSDKNMIKIKTEPASPSIARPKTATVSPPLPSSPPRQVAKSEHAVPGSSVPFTIDESHVRPGLALNQSRYDTAKDIVLDLLGWGVSPEYLVDCGLSREIVFYVFTELRLRLPTNLDTTGIPPYTPELLQSVYEGRVPSSPSSLPMRKPVSRSQTYPHLPLKPSQGLTSSSTCPTSSNAASLLPSQTDNSPSLHDIEQQRRRELLARKAVLASRKGKNPPARRTPSLSPSPTASSVNEPVKDVEMVPAETVDDFLNSIGPVDDQMQQNVNQAPNSADTTKSSDPPPGASTPIAMDVDEIPGFVTSEGSGVWSTLSSSLTFSSLEVSSTSHNDIPSVSNGEPSSADSLQSMMSFASHQVDMALSKSDVNELATPNGDDVSIAPRRGTKRPVAADFVDYEGEPVLDSNGNATHIMPPFAKRKLGSFASVSGMRRCVIDLSDSEEDGFEDIGIYRNSMHPPYSFPTRQAPWVASGTVASTATPPIGIQVPPAALVEKEQEIKRMREMIAQREQSRLRKLVMSSRNTSVESHSPMSTPGAKVDTPPSNPPVQSTSSTPAPVDSTDEELPFVPINEPVINGEEHSGKPVLIEPHPLKPPNIAVVINSAEDSDITTPIDTASLSTEGLIIGDQVLTNEAQQEEAIDARVYAEMSTEDQDDVEVDGVTGFETSSTQEQLEEQTAEDRETPHDGWSTYHSPLESYPLLRWHSQIVADAGTTVSESTSSSSSQATSCTTPDISTHSSTSISTSTMDWPDLKTLRTATICKAFDSERRICQYEVPGGGECRDAQCEDMHINRALVIEPGDDDTAQYLYDTMPVDQTKQDKPSVKVIKDALEDVRRKKGMTMVFDDRVTMALSMLGLR